MAACRNAAFTVAQLRDRTWRAARGLVLARPAASGLTRGRGSDCFPPPCSEAEAPYTAWRVVDVGLVHEAGRCHFARTTSTAFNTVGTGLGGRSGAPTELKTHVQGLRPHCQRNGFRHRGRRPERGSRRLFRPADFPARARPRPTSVPTACIGLVVAVIIVSQCSASEVKSWAVASAGLCCTLVWHIV